MRKLWWVVVAAAVVALMPGCRTGSGTAGNVFRYPLMSPPTELDPARVQDGDTIDMLQQVFEGLVKWAPDNTVAANLAEKWEVLEGGTLYRFHIKKGVKFHNGDELTAQDFVYSLDRAVDPAEKSPTAVNYLFDIVGARERADGKSKQLSGVRAPDKATLEIKIDKPRAYFLAKLTYPCAYAVNKRAISDAGGGNIINMVGVVGTGPFRMTEYNRDQRVVLRAFDGYHGGKPKLRGIVRPIIVQATTRFDQYKRGRIDLIQLDKADLKAALADESLKSQVRYFERPSIYYLGMNQIATPVFRDVRVRQAFAMAIDKQKIVDGPLEGQVQRADCLVPPGIPANDPSLKLFPFDPAKARELLAAAGYPGGKGFPSLTLHFREGQPDVRRVAEVLQEQLKSTLGVNIELRVHEWSEYLAENNSKRALGLFHMRWMADYLDPQDFLSVMLTTDGGENKIGYSNKEFDALCAQADGEQDPAKRVELYKKAQRIALQEAPLVPIYFQRDAELIRPSVKGIRDCLLGHLPHVTTYIEAGK